MYIAGESSNWVIRLCNAICELGHEVTAIVQSLDEYDKENPIQSHPNLKRIDVEYDNFFKPQYIHNKLLVEMSNNKYDFIMGSHAPVSPVIQSLANVYKLPWGIMILDIPTNLMKENRYRMANWIYWFDVLKFANIIIFNTQTARDEYFNYTRQYFNDSYVIPYAINTPKEYDLAGANIRGDYVLSICRINKAKNCSTIVKALSKLNQKIRYVAIGRNNGEGELELMEKLCKINSIPMFFNSLVSEKDKFEIIKNCSMLVYPQNSEYIAGLSPLEAMYVGKPVIVPDVKVLRDLYGKHATYYSHPLDSESLAEKIAYVHNKKLVKEDLVSANEYVKKNVTFKVMAEKMVNKISEWVK